MPRHSYREHDYAFGQTMLTLRTSISLTQAGLAALLGVSRRAVAEWEGGLSYPKAERLKQFIALIIQQQQAFPNGREEEEIRALWKAAHQKILLDEAWLQDLLAPAAPVELSSPAETPVIPAADTPTGKERGGHLHPSASARGEAADTDSPPRYQNLPPPLTPLIGREQEEREIRTFLLRPEVRLLTLTGAGGIGKTRLALQVAADLVEAFTHGVCLVQLTPISDAGLVAPTIAQTLGLQDVEEHLLFGSLKAFLRRRHLLLLLDNFERVLAAAPTLVELLVACPSIKMLVTSRAVLHVEGEYEFALPTLSLPDAQRLPAHEELQRYGAVELFVQRAQAVDRHFALTEENAAAVAEICIQLDGLPLALELAAARSKLLPPQVLLRRLSHRLAVLTGGRQDAPARQQTLRDTINWSYDLLRTEEQRCFHYLAIFVGGCTLEAAEALCGEGAHSLLPATDLIASLLDKSLLQQSDWSAGQPRLSMLETIREYALEMLADSGELETAAESHAMYYLTLAERSEPLLFGHQQRLWMGLLTAEAENMRAALQWSQTHERDELLLRLAGNLGHFWYMCGRFGDALFWIETALRLEPPRPAISARIKALYIVALIAGHLGQSDLLFARARECLALATQQADSRGFVIASWPLVHYLLASGDLPGARTQAEEALAFVRAHAPAEDSWTLACALNAYGSVLLSEGEYTQAQQSYERAIALFKEAGDLWLYGELHLFLANAYWVEGAEATAQNFFKEGLTVHDQVGNAWVTGWFVSLFGEIALRQGDIPRARFLLEAGLKRHQQRGDQQGQARIYALLAQAATSEQDFTLTRKLAAQSLEIARAMHDSRSLIQCLEELADVATDLGEPEWAARLWGAADRYREGVRPALPSTERPGRARHIEQAQHLLGEQVFAEKRAEGRTMTAEQAVVASPNR